jgi:hypothetical protein
MMDVLKATGKVLAHVLAHVLTFGGCPMERGEYLYRDPDTGRDLYLYTDLFGRKWVAPGEFSFLSRQEAEFDMVGYWTVKQPRPR